MFNLNGIDNNKLSFYREIKTHIDSCDYINLEKKFSDYFNNDLLVFNNIPIELDIAKQIYLNNGNFFPTKIEKSTLIKCSEDDLSLAGVSETVINELMREYIFLDNSIYAATSGDGCSQVMKELSTALKSIAEIVCERSITVTEAGKRQWVRLQYAHESHWDENNMSTYMNHPTHGERISGNSVGIIFFKKKNKNHNIRDIKEEMRSLLSLSPSLKPKEIFPHVHFPDTYKEVKWLANAVFNQNSQDWMNRACDVYPKKFSILIDEYIKEMAIRDDQSKFCLDTGAVMGLNGIRDTEDIDYISIGDSEKPIVNDRMGSHNSQYKEYNKSVREIIENPSCHFLYKNIKASTLEEVLAFKEYRSEINRQSPSSKKDRQDASMIKNYIGNFAQLKEINDSKSFGIIGPDKQILKRDTSLKSVLIGILQLRAYIFKTFVTLAKIILPSSLLSPLRRLYGSLRLKSRSKVKKRIPNTLR